MESFFSSTFVIYFAILPVLGGLILRVCIGGKDWWVGGLLLVASAVMSYLSLLQTSLSVDQRIYFIVMLAIGGAAVIDFFKFVLPRPIALLWVAEVVAVFLLLQHIGYFVPLKVFWQLWK